MKDMDGKPNVEFTGFQNWRERHMLEQICLQRSTILGTKAHNLDSVVDTGDAQMSS